MFCASCGAAMSADAKFCPKCGAAAAARPGAIPPTPAPDSPSGGGQAAAGALDLADPKIQAELACGLTAGLLFIFGIIGIANSGGVAWGYMFGFLDIALGACAAQAIVHSRKRRFPQARQMAAIVALGMVVLGVLVLVLYQGAAGLSVVISLLLAALTGFAYWRFSKLS